MPDTPFFLLSVKTMNEPTNGLSVYGTRIIPYVLLFNMKFDEDASYDVIRTQKIRGCSLEPLIL